MPFALVVICSGDRFARAMVITAFASPTPFEPFTLPATLKVGVAATNVWAVTLVFAFTSCESGENCTTVPSDVLYDACNVYVPATTLIE